MHIPDGFLNEAIWIPAVVVSAAAISIASKKSKSFNDEKAIPRLGLVSAFIFAAQMINFPVAAGTSGHLLGASLATALMGPWLSVLSLSIVLIIQCLIFQDGGLTALGANIFNMAIVAVTVSYIIQKIFSKSEKYKIFGIALSSFFSVIAASFLCSLELGFSGIIPVKYVVPAMTLIYSLIGIGEAVITVMVYKAILRIIPDYNLYFFDNKNLSK